MRRVSIAILAGLLLSTNLSPAVACSCVPFTKPQLVENATTIFTATAQGFSRVFGLRQACSPSTGDVMTVHFEVETVFKGDPPRKVSVSTVIGGASCGYEFAAGKRYTVFATGSVDALETNLCRGNVEGEIVAADYGLAAGRPPK